MTSVYEFPYALASPSAMRTDQPLPRAQRSLGQFVSIGSGQR